MIPRLAENGAPNAATAATEGKLDLDDGGWHRRQRAASLAHMERYAREGLRTLLVACGDLEEDVFSHWERRSESVGHMPGGETAGV